MNPQKRGTGQVHHESESLSALGEGLAERLEQQAGPGVYLAGQRLIGTKAVGTDQMLLEFEGGWDLLITGVFKLTLREKPSSPFPEPQQETEFDVEAEAVDETDLIEEGKRLLGGSEGE